MPLSGEPIRASDRDTQYLARVRATATQSINDSSATPLLFDTDDVDDDGGHSTVTNTSRYTAQRDGRYLATAVGFHGSSTAGTSRNLSLAINGADYIGATVSSGPRPGGTGSFQQNLAPVLVTLVVGDYLELRLTQNSGGALATAAGSNMTIVFLGE